MDSSQTGCDSHNHHIAWTPLREEPFLSPQMYWQRSCSHGKLTGRNHIPVEFKTPRNWVEDSQCSSPKPGLLSYLLTIQKPAAVRGHILLFCCFMEKEKNLWKHWKIYFWVMEEDAAVFCHSGWVFILLSIKRNKCHVFHIGICTVFVLMLNAALACRAKGLLVIFPQPWHQRNSAFKGIADTILKMTYRLGFFSLIWSSGRYRRYFP